MSSDRAWWADTPAHVPQVVCEEVMRSRQYLEIHDGIRLAANVYRPALADTEQIPALVSFTPYVREMEFRLPGAEWLLKRAGLLGTDWGVAFARLGYAFLHVEIQGAGASYGTKTSIFADQVARDGADVLDWIVAQPWSNGRVGSTGISALGLTGMMLAAGKHPALKAIAPRFTTFDIFASVHPGGLLQNRFLDDIGLRLRAMDAGELHKGFEKPLMRALMWLLVRGIRGVDADPDRRMLAEALAQHEANEAFDLDIVSLYHRDDRFAHSARPATIDDQSPSGYLADINASGVAVYAYDGWYDGAFQRDLIHLYVNSESPGKRLTLGPWAHGGAFFCGPSVGKRKQRSEFDQAAELVRFFDPHLRDVDSGSVGEPPVHYFTMVENRWKAASSWPPPGATTSRLHLAGDRRLALSAGPSPDTDTYLVDRTASTGVWSRHGKHLAGGIGPAYYADRADADRKLLCYDSEPLVEDTEVTGHPIVTLSLSCDTTDAALLVYLEDVAPDGTVQHVSEGDLRLSFRKVGTDPPYRNLGIWRTGSSTDAAPVVPGEVMEIVLDLLPVSWLFVAGHRIRLALSGADADNFVTVPPAGPPPTFSVHRGPNRPCFIDLPVVDRRGGEHGGS